MKDDIYIYFDSNIFQYMKNQPADIFWSDFIRVFNTLKRKYKFPLSYAHLRDLALSPIPSFDTGDIVHLNNITEHNYILEDLSIIQQDLNAFYDKEEIKGTFFKRQDDNKTNSIKEIINKNKSSDMLLKELIYFLPLNISNPNVYKEFRVIIQKMKKDFNKNSTIDVGGDLFKNLLPLLDFLISQDVSCSSFKDALNIIMSFNEANKEIDYKQIEAGYFLLDFNQKMRDKITNGNTINNMLVDVAHLCYARKAKYYVTADKKHFEKSKFLFECLDIKVQVISPKEFLSKFNVL
ncbi:hypothetical protein A4G20_04025 [Pasteurellaceae bacterium RH1A]|nr:hypothetical protein A4G20_04025 [Pasteurellaceae bacterium RH1A]